MIGPSDCVLAGDLIQEANYNGARIAKACEELNINIRTYQRWVSDGRVKEDQRPHVPRPEPKNKLMDEEREEIIKKAVNVKRFKDAHNESSDISNASTAVPI